MSEENKKEYELTDEEAGSVAGGIGTDDITLMECNLCGRCDIWLGNYINGEYYQCLYCKTTTKRGIGWLPCGPVPEEWKIKCGVD